MDNLDFYKPDFLITPISQAFKKVLEGCPYFRRVFLKMGFLPFCPI